MFVILTRCKIETSAYYICNSIVTHPEYFCADKNYLIFNEDD